MDSEDSDSDVNVPSVLVNGKSVPLTDVDDDVIAQMTPTEKDTYIQVYQEYYSHMYDWSSFHEQIHFYIKNILLCFIYLFITLFHYFSSWEAHEMM